MLSLNQKPSFILAGIKHSEFLEKFKRGDFDKIQEFKINKVIGSLKPAISDDQGDASFSFKDKTGIVQIVHTTGVDYTNISCHWCRRKFSHHGLGIPIKLIDKTMFLMDGNYCGYRCMFASLHQKLLLKDGSSIYNSSMPLAKMLFKIQYPDSPTPNNAPPWELLTVNGGSMSDSEYDSLEYKYIPSPTVLIEQARKQFIRVKS